jgi:hypothetical protein
MQILCIHIYVNGKMVPVETIPVMWGINTLDLADIYRIQRNLNL